MSKVRCECPDWPRIAKIVLWDDNIGPYMLDDDAGLIEVRYCPGCGGLAPRRLPISAGEQPTTG
jgi:hypothetical protein